MFVLKVTKKKMTLVKIFMTTRIIFLTLGHIMSDSGHQIYDSKNSIRILILNNIIQGILNLKSYYFSLML